MAKPPWLLHKRQKLQNDNPEKWEADGWKAEEAPRDDSIRALADCLTTNHEECKEHSTYYAPYVVIIQSTGAAKSRTIIQLKSKHIPVLYFCLREHDEGWPPSDRPLTKFLKQPPNEDRHRRYQTWASEASEAMVANASPLHLEAYSRGMYLDVDDVKDYLLFAIENAEKNHDINADSVTGIPSCNTCWQHLLSVCFIYGILQYLENNILNGQALEEVLEQLNSETGNAPDNPKRTAMMKEIKNIAEAKLEMTWGMDWFNLFKPDRVMNTLSSRWFWENEEQLKSHFLIQDTVALANRIRSQGATRLPLLVALDEIAGLGVGGTKNEDEWSEAKDYRLVSTLTRSLTLFRPPKVGDKPEDKPAIWFLFATTLGMTEVVAPRSLYSNAGGPSVPSARKALLTELPPLRTWPFFHRFSMDLWVDANLASSFNIPRTWDDVKYITCFGRPLWKMYQDPEVLTSRVWLKLNGGRGWDTPVSIHTKIVDNKMRHEHFLHFSLATLSHLIILDPVLTNSDNFEILKTAVNGYMRYCHFIDVDKRLITTATLSDPPVSWVLMRDFHTCPPLFNEVVKVILSSLVGPGELDLGDFGELYTRLTLVHTRLFSKPLSFYVSVEDFLVQWLQIGSFESHFKIEEKYVASLHKLATGWINFNHFWHIEQEVKVSHDQFGILLRNAFRRGAAILPPHNQEFTDLIVPVYHGSLNEVFDPCQLSPFLIQVKNRRSKRFSPFVEFQGPRDSTYDYGRFDQFKGSGDETIRRTDDRGVMHESRWYTSRLNEAKHDILYVCLDLGSEGDGIHLLRHTPPRSDNLLWAVCVYGRDNINYKLPGSPESVDRLFLRTQQTVLDTRFVDIDNASQVVA